MSTVSLVGELIDGVVDSNGVRVASGNAHFYALGTLTPITVYSDKAGASPISQPLVLTAGGTGVVYTTGAARMIVKDALDTSTILDVNVNTPRIDGVYVTSTAFNGGVETTLKTVMDGWTAAFGGAAGLWQYKQSAGATERNPGAWMSETHVSVKDFGAIGDDSTDNATAIQAAVTAVGAAGGGIVYFPPGTYRYSVAISITSDATYLVGAGEGATILRQTNASADAITVAIASVRAGTVSVLISDMSINALTSSTGAVVRQSTGGAVMLQRVVSTQIGGAQQFQSGMIIGAGASSDNENYVIDSNIQVTGAGGFAVSTPAGGLMVRGSTLSGDTGISSTSTTHNLYVMQSFVTSTGGGASIQYTGSASVYVLGGQGTLSVSSGATGVFTDLAMAQVASFAVNSSVTPNPGTKYLRINATAVIIVTINAITAATSGPFIIECINNSGGAVTWTFNGQYHTSAAVAPSTGNRIAVTFRYDATDGLVYEMTRSAAVPN